MARFIESTLKLDYVFEMMKARTPVQFGTGDDSVTGKIRSIHCSGPTNWTVKVNGSNQDWYTISLTDPL